MLAGMSTSDASRERSVFDEISWAKSFITSVVDACPRRMATSEDERRAHAMIRSEMAALGLSTETHAFEFNASLYANLALHFGLGTLGSLAAGRAPALGLALHALSAGSYALDSSRRAFVLRRLFPFRASQNVLGTMPARGEPRLRIVFLAHADAAFTGLVFRPTFTRLAKPGPLYKSLRIATGALAGLAAVDIAQLVFGRTRALSVLRGALTVPPLLAALLNIDVVLRDQIVPGAMDDLSGVAGMLLLARRLRATKPDDVELVFVATGCEEAGMGGAQALARDYRDRWDPAKTVVLGLDGFANGELRWFTEGEIFPVKLAPWLSETIGGVAASDPRFAEVRAFEIPVGATDAAPFATGGFPAVTLGCVDPGHGTPRHYHLPTDTPENLEADKIPMCVDFAERVVAAVVARAAS
jgi:hypothetical protein